MYNKIYNDPYEREQIFYPYCWWNNAFSEEELESIKYYCNSLNLTKGTTGNSEETNTKIRNSNIQFFKKNSENNWIFERLNRTIESLNDQFYNFNLNGYDSIQYTVYNSYEKQHYDFHMDTFMTYDRSQTFSSGFRKLSLILCLSHPDEYEGGEFQIIGGDPNDPHVLEQQYGRIIIFPSFMIHRVTPITSGIRKSLVIWVTGPKFI